MTIKGVSQWDSKKTVEESEFVLPKEDFKPLYETAESRYKEYKNKKDNGEVPEKRAYKPVTQLSPKGLALNSYLYAEKDKKSEDESIARRAEAQPVIASTVSDLKHIAKLMENAPPGTSITVIFQPTDPQNIPYSIRQFFRITGGFSPVHKTVLHFERSENGIDVLSLDSTNNSVYSSTGEAILQGCLQENAKAENRPETQLRFFKQNNPENPSKPDTLSMQADEYQCGVFASKMARELHKDPDLAKSMIKSAESSEYGVYEIPPVMQKGVQSSIYKSEAIRMHGEAEVTSDKRTLQEVQEKTRDSNKPYIDHFSLKYKNQVQDHVEETLSQPNGAKQLKQQTERYDAGKMTPERLKEVYGPNSRQEEKENVSQNLAGNVKPNSNENVRDAVLGEVPQRSYLTSMPVHAAQKNKPFHVEEGQFPGLKADPVINSSRRKIKPG